MTTTRRELDPQRPAGRARRASPPAAAALGDRRDRGDGRGARPAGRRSSPARPGWPRVQETFFSWDDAKASFPAVIKGFGMNVLLFLHRRAADPGARRAGRGGPLHDGGGAVPAPVAGRLLHRPVPRGAHAAGGDPGRLRDPGPAAPGRSPTTPSGWACSRWCSRTAPTSPRSSAPGIDSIHPSQVASADALGLSHGQAMRYVVLPQATRRVVPPAAQRLHLAAEGHRAAVGDLRVRGVVRRAGLRGVQLQLHPDRRGRRAVRGADDPAWRGSPTGWVAG